MSKIAGILTEQRDKGNIVILSPEGLQAYNLKAFCEQNVEGMLYDLNRDDVTCITFAETERSWVNNYACAQVIKELKRQVEELKQLTL